MAFVIRFVNYKPTGRDTGKWTQAVIQQAPLASTGTAEPGTWSTIETKVIPDYPTVTDPPVMNFTTELATELPGWYRILFRDATGDEEQTMPRYFAGATLRPSTRDVANYVKNRTITPDGNYLGDFSDATHATGVPMTSVTATEVNELIVKAENRVLRRMDIDPNEQPLIPAESQAALSDLMALYAGMLIELTKFGEQIARRTSPYPELKVLFDEQLLEMRDDIRNDVILPGEPDPSGPGGTGVAGFGTAQYTFPEDVGGMISWETDF